MNWRIFHKDVTASTNLDARVGEPGDVFTADFQTAGRGRLDHKWESAKGKNIIMSVVLPVDAHEPEEVATLPLVVGLAVAKAAKGLLKWPNDVYLNGKKAAGILCERVDDRVIAGIGVNVGEVPVSVSDRATNVPGLTIAEILKILGETFAAWRYGGFAALYPEIRKIDYLKGKTLAVRQTDTDDEPVRGISGGILADGSLDVGGEAVYAGEAHVEEMSHD